MDAVFLAEGDQVRLDLPVNEIIRWLPHLHRPLLLKSPDLLR
jgi:hypothetical protein